MAWSPQARAAAAAARKSKRPSTPGGMRNAKGGRQFPRSNNAERAVGVKWGAEMHSQVGPTNPISKPASASAKANVTAHLPAKSAPKRAKPPRGTGEAYFGPGGPAERVAAAKAKVYKPSVGYFAPGGPAHAIAKAKRPKRK